MTKSKKIPLPHLKTDLHRMPSSAAYCGLAQMKCQCPAEDSKQKCRKVWGHWIETRPELHTTRRARWLPPEKEKIQQWSDDHRICLDFLRWQLIYILGWPAVEKMACAAYLGSICFLIIWNHVCPLTITCSRKKTSKMPFALHQVLTTFNHQVIWSLLVS